jgi:hypothetical protein
MRRMPFVLVLLISLSVRAQSVCAQAPTAPIPSGASATERTLLTLENQWAGALVRRDASFFRRTLDPNYVYTDERGVFTKDQVIAEQTGGTDTVTFATNDEMRVHRFGDATAVVTGMLIVRGRGANGAFEHRYRYTDTWAKRGTRWLMVASQDYDTPAR